MTYMYTVNVYLGVVFFHIKRFAKMGRKCIVDKCIYVKAKTEQQFNLRSLNARTKSIWFIQMFINLFLDSVYMSQNVLNRENFQIQVKKKSVMLPTYEAALVFSIGKHPD